MRVAKSIEDYQYELLNGKFNQEFDNIDFDRLMKVICDFINNDYKLFRKKKIKNFFEKLALIGFTPNVYPNFTKGQFKAYMTDDLKLYFNNKFINTSSRTNLIITLVHEASHLYLNSSDNYQALLDLDKEYFKKYPKDSETILISPVEFTADFLMNKIFLKVCLCLKGKIRENITKTLNKRNLFLLEQINKHMGV
jgi:hypothetical protein